ncbi:prolactin-releasing peptide receptor-like isoform X1 [Paramuricea clavata]|uniref:Prolactin-releasing peptide receptor-like isoform X1 n=1 Tax=Paramuricea clavata TaxID=317549 RepID=A0A7D9DDX7_PARCT|nr:prolactin-releasing peptide receptor-like isoform X1 [Paramuricea clavata]
MASVSWQGIFLTIIIIATLFGNILCLYILLKPQRRLLKRPLYIFIFNICVADIAVVVCSMLVKTADEFHQDWFYGKAMCQIIEYSQRALFRVNVLTHLSIAFERYFSVVFALKPQEKSGNRICQLIHLPWGWVDKLYCSIDLIIFFLIPLGILLFLYGSIITTLNRRKRQTGDLGSINATMNTIRAAIRGVRVSIIVVVAFIICWIPVIVKGFNRLIVPNVNSDRTDPLYATAMYLAFTNDAIVPLLYCVLDSNLAPSVKKIFDCFQDPQDEESSEENGTIHEL